MPLRDFHCASCDLTAEHFYSPAVHPACKRCGGPVEMTTNLQSGRSKTAVFPFTTPHIDGSPMVIENLGHLRRIEKDYGVVLSAFSQNPSNPDPIRDLPRFRQGGRRHRD